MIASSLLFSGNVLPDSRRDSARASLTNCSFASRAFPSHSLCACPEHGWHKPSSTQAAIRQHSGSDQAALRQRSQTVGKQPGGATGVD